MNQPRPDPEFLTPEGERAWSWLRRHLDRANAFWLAFVLTEDLVTQRVLRERVRANRRLRAAPLVTLQPATPAQLAALVDELEERGAASPGCTWVAAPQLSDEEWLDAWRTFLLGLNHRRDVLRARLGGLVIAAPPAVKVVAQQESPDLWSVRDLLVELAARPSRSIGGAERREVASRGVEAESIDGAHGLAFESEDEELAEEAQVLLAMPLTDLAGLARERTTRIVHRAIERGERQLAAMLLLAQALGYGAVGDGAGALHLVQEGLALYGIDPSTRERLLNSGVALASAVSELELARHYAAESVALTEQRTGPDDLVSLRDLSVSLIRLGDVTRDLGDPTTARTHYREALDIARRLADQHGTPQAVRDLSCSLERLGDVTRDLGDPATAHTHYREALDIARRLADQHGTPEALRGLSFSLIRLGNAARDLGDPTTARTHYREALDLRRRLADQLGTIQSLRDLRTGLTKLATTEDEFGNSGQVAALRAEVAEVDRRLDTLLDDKPD